MATSIFDTVEYAGPSPLTGEGEGPAPILGSIPREPAGTLGSNQANSGQVMGIPPANTFFLHSRPTAKKTIYLDFDGFTAEGTSWNRSNNIASIVSPAWDPDGNGAAFTNNELSEIQKTWQRVAADYAPFDVDVTTEDPGEANLVNTGGADDRWGIRAVNTLTNFSNQPVGGFAYIGSFRWNYESAGATDTPAYIFNSTAMTVAAAVSHEVGHALGLSHDGTNANNPIQQNSEYYDGHGSGETGWGPIMGAGYYSNVTSWDDGTYLGSSNGATTANFGSGPSDLATIASSVNGFGFVPDSDGNSDTLATSLIGTAIPGGRLAISKLSTIETSSDVDFFKFQTGSGVVDITIDPYVTEVWTKNSSGGYTQSVETSFFDGNRWDENQGANLDIEATLYDGAGNVIAVSNPTGLRASFSNLDLRVGTYYIRVDGVGFGDPKANPPTGYSDFGSIGQYLITGSIASSIEIGISGGVNYIENTAPVNVSPNATLTTFNISTFEGGVLQFAIASNFQTGDQLGLRSFGVGPGALSIVGNNVSYGGVLIGVVNAGPRSLTVAFNAAVTSEAIEAVIRALTFEHTTDSPISSTRLVSIFLDNANNGASNTVFANVTVVPVNDSPVLTSASLPDVAEDSSNPPGLKVSSLFNSSFQDVDLGSSLAGIAVTANNAAANTGSWQYSLDGSTWSSIGTVSPIAGLLVSKDSWIRFLPVADFNGSPTPLRIRGLDNTFAGAFSSQSIRTTIDVNSMGFSGPLSLADSLISTRIFPVNDPPIALVASPKLESREDETFSFVIPTASWFKDVDDAVLTLSLLQSSGENLPAWLTFDSATSKLSGLPNNENVGDYALVVRATDSSNDVAFVEFTLSILNVNDAPTRISLIGDSVVENSSGGLVGNLFASDPDANDSIFFSMLSNDSRFLLVDNQLFVAAGRSFDFEQTPTVDLIIRATDAGNPALFLDKTVQINILDVNEFAPTLRPSTFRIQENTLPLTTVGTVLAQDGDTAQAVKYRFFGTPPSGFAIEPNTGKIALSETAAIDFERTDSYQFIVEAYDNGAPQLSTASSVNIVVEDVNEFAPTIVTTSISISEKQITDIEFATIQASDLDTKQKLAFSLPATEARFSIQPDSGKLTLKQTGLFDYEQSRTGSMVVRVTDPEGRFEDKTITINVTDANDPPTGGTVGSPTLLSNIGEIDLGLVTVADQDAGQSYSIQSLDDRFVIQNGRLTLAQGKFLTESDPVAMTVPISATEVGPNPITYQLTIGLNRVSNPKPWQNRSNALNVDRSTAAEGQLVDPRDALAVINAINSNRLGKLPIPRPASTLGQSDLDADGDGFLSPLDVLVIVNFLNGQSSSGSGEGESAIAVQAPFAAPMVDSTSAREVDQANLWLTAFQQIEEEQVLMRRRRG